MLRQTSSATTTSTGALMPRIAPGDRIVLLSMPHDPDPVPVGTEGTVEEVNDVGPGAFTQVEVSGTTAARSC
jgi:hypothetical protein